MQARVTFDFNLNSFVWLIFRRGTHTLVQLLKMTRVLARGIFLAIGLLSVNNTPQKDLWNLYQVSFWGKALFTISLKRVLNFKWRHKLRAQKLKITLRQFVCISFIQSLSTMWIGISNVDNSDSQSTAHFFARAESCWPRDGHPLDVKLSCLPSQTLALSTHMRPH